MTNVYSPEAVSIMYCRYLVIACPLWYRFRRTIKVSLVVCVVVWALPLICVITLVFWDFVEVADTICAIFFLLPLPLFIFFLGGTLKALSASISVHSDEKRRIVGMLVLVLLIYMLLFLPSIIWLLAERDRYNNTSKDLSSVFLSLSPLADLILYVFMRKGTIDKLLASVCCCRMDSSEIIYQSGNPSVKKKKKKKVFLPLQVQCTHALHFQRCPQGIAVLFANTLGRKPAEFSYISHFSRRYITV